MGKRAWFLCSFRFDLDYALILQSLNFVQLFAFAFQDCLEYGEYDHISANW